MKNETIDKLKNAGYITVTDDSQGIADKVGITSGGSDTPIDPSEHVDDYFTVEILSSICPVPLIGMYVLFNNSGETDIPVDETLKSVLNSYYEIQCRINGGEWISLEPNYDDFTNIPAGTESELYCSLTSTTVPFYYRGDKIEFRHTGSIIINPGDLTDYPSITAKIQMGVATDIQYNISGNIMSLLYGDDFKNKTILDQDLVFSEMFASQNVLNAGNLVLPATTLTQECYSYMFADCNNLITAPLVPATTLAPSCYSRMFAGCISLYTPQYHLPATTLADGCYTEMFNNTSISQFKVDAVSHIDPDTSFTQELTNLNENEVLVVDDIEPYKDFIEQVEGNPQIVIVKSDEQYIDFYGYENSEIQISGINQLLVSYLDFKKIWDEKRDTDLSAYHIKLNGNNINSVFFDEESGGQGLIFNAENEYGTYMLMFGMSTLISSENYGFVLMYNVSKDPYDFEDTSDEKISWDAAGITDDMVTKWKNILLNCPGYSTTDTNELNKFNVEFKPKEDEGEYGPLTYAEYIPSGETEEKIYFSGNWEDQDHRSHTGEANVYLQDRTVKVAIDKLN